MTLTWIIRILVILFLVRMAVRFVTAIMQGASSPTPSRKPKSPGTIEGGQLVRDPHCGTYVPIGRALREGSGATATYFCSEDCRRAWAARKTG